MIAFAVRLCLLAVLAWVMPALAATPAGAPVQALEARFAEWEQVIAAADAEAGSLSPERMELLQAGLAEVRNAAQATKLQAQARLKTLTGQLAALGAAPAEGQPPETAEVARQRRLLTEEVAALDGQVKTADLVVAQVRAVEQRVSATSRQRALSEVTERYPSLLLPTNATAAVRGYLDLLHLVVRSPSLWWRGLPAEKRARYAWPQLLLALVVMVLLGWVLRRLLLRRFGPDPGNTQPTFARRIGAAVAGGLGNGLVPTLVFGALLYAVHLGIDPQEGLFHDVAVAFCVAGMFFALARALPRAVLAPDLPAWRLEPLQPANARTISRLLSLLAAVFALDIFLVMATQDLRPGTAMVSLHVLLVRTLEGALVLALMRGRLWQRDRAREASEERQPEATVGDAARAATRRRFWAAVRALVSLLVAVGITAALVGYSNLAGRLISAIVITGVIAGAAYLVRGLLRELIGVALRKPAPMHWLGLEHGTRSLLEFWLRGTLDVVMAIAVGVLVLPAWGIPPREVLRWLGNAMQGFTIGQVTISITDLLVALLVFVVVMTVTRAVQRALSERVLPQTTLDTGVRHSIAAGVGYLGIAIAAGLAISAAGLDLSNLALVAGALSVGIGFGLQTVVNNFVSGLILLVERPIKVGDWIVTGSHEGIVKRIRVRSTELETFQRASVIIPNSELIATPVVNWTHQNRTGRMEVQVGVSYDSDPDVVLGLLKEVLDEEPRVLEFPAPQVLFFGFGASSLDFELRGFLGDVDSMVGLRSDIRLAVWRKLKDAGIAIPFPQQDVHIKDIERIVAAIEGLSPVRRGADEPATPPGSAPAPAQG